MDLDQRADLVGDVVGDRVGTVVDRLDAGQLDRYQGGDVVGLAGHGDVRHEVDVEAGELGDAQIRGDRHTQRDPPIGNTAARFEREAEEIAQVQRRGGSQGCLGILQSASGSVQIDVERVPGRATEPGEEGGGALEHPRLGFGAEHPGEQPVVGELALEVGKLGLLLAGTLAKAIGYRVPKRARFGVRTLCHRRRASAMSASRFEAPARCSSSSSSAGPSPRSSPNRWAYGATASATSRG